MYDMFLFDTLPQQQSNMASYELAGRKVCLLVSGSNVDEKLRTEVLGESTTP